MFSKFAIAKNKLMNMCFNFQMREVWRNVADCSIAEVQLDVNRIGLLNKLKNDQIGIGHWRRYNQEQSFSNLAEG